MDCQIMRDAALENMKSGMRPRVALLKLLDDTLNEKQRNFVVTHTPQIPTISKMMEIIPWKDRPDCDEFRKTLAWELAAMAFYAANAKKPQIILDEGRVEGTQYIFEFAVSDLEEPSGDRVNWHGQNTSQWKYAGCILVQNGKISTHH